MLHSTQDQPAETATNNYLYLHSNENPVISLVSPVLDPTNYHSWIHSIVLWLQPFIQSTR